MQQQLERENFFRNSTLLVDYGNESVSGLLEKHLKNEGLTLHQFIQLKQHEIYHLCYPTTPCCRCSNGHLHPAHKHRNRILLPAQLSILLDRSSGCGRSPHCCCGVNVRVQIDQLDLSLSRCILLNLTPMLPEGSPEKSAVDDLIKYRNECAHATKASISSQQYQIYKAQIEQCLLTISAVLGKVDTMKQKLQDAAMRPLDDAICRLYQTTLLEITRKGSISTNKTEIKDALRSVIQEEKEQYKLQTVPIVSGIVPKIYNLSSSLQNGPDIHEDHGRSTTSFEHVNIDDIVIEEPHNWCSIKYYEYRTRIGEVYHATQDDIVVDGFTEPSHSGTRFSLGPLSNVNRHDTITNTRCHIGKGIHIYNLNGDVSLECLSASSVFVQSPISNFQHGFQQNAVVKVPTNGTFKMFNRKLFTSLIGQAVNHGFEKVYAMLNMCTIRVSFVKGWGENYRRQYVTSTPCWIEVQLNGPLRFLDGVLVQMGEPTSNATSVS